MMFPNGIGTGQREIVKATPKAPFQTFVYLLVGALILGLLSCAFIGLIGWRVIAVAVGLVLAAGVVGGITTGARFRHIDIKRSVACFTGTVVSGIFLLLFLMNIELLKTFWPVPVVEMHAYGTQSEFSYTADDGVILENGQPMADITATLMVDGHALEARGSVLYVDDKPEFEYTGVEILDVVPYVDGKEFKLLGFIPLVFDGSMLTTWNRFRGGVFLASAGMLIAVVVAWPGALTFIATSVRELLDPNSPPTRQQSPWYVSPLFWVQAIFDPAKRNDMWDIATAGLRPPPEREVLLRTTEVRGVRRPGVSSQGTALTDDGGPAWVQDGGVADASIHVPESIVTTAQLEGLAQAMMERNRTESDPDEQLRVSEGLCAPLGLRDRRWRRFAAWMVDEKLLYKPNSRVHQLTDPAGLDFMSAYGFNAVVDIQ